MKNSHIKILTIVILVCLTLIGSAASFHSPAYAAPERTSLLRFSFGTAGLGGNFYVLGTALCQLFNKNIPMVEFTPEVTGGSGVNVGLTHKNDVQVSLCTNVAAYNGYNGKGWVEGDPMPDVRTVAGLMPAALELYVLASSNIHTIQDYNGKIFSAATTGGGGDMGAHDLLPTLGIKVKQKQDMTLPDVNSNLIDGLLDCAMDFATFPHASRLELEASAKIRFIELSAAERKLMCDTFPYYVDGVMPAGTYRDIPPEGYKTIMSPNLMICHKDVPEDVVYDMLKVMFEGMDVLKLSSNAFSNVVKESVLDAAIPLHPGAIRYFKEIGYTIPDKLIPEGYVK